jgi:hypothetical protein
VLACVLLPARPTALHPHFKQTFAGCLDVASTERQTKSARTGIIHTIGLAAMALEIGDRLMDRMVCAYTFIPPRSDQFLQNVGRRTAAVEEGFLPAPEPFAAAAESSSTCATAPSFSVR